MSGGLHPDHIVRASAIHVFDDPRSTARSVALYDGAVVALADRADGLDALAGPATQIHDCRDLTFLPGFFDIHNHMLAAGRDLEQLSLVDVRTIDELLECLISRAAGSTSGEWIVPSRNWHESNLRERRLPTALELDAVDRPVALRRGGHVMVANTAALALAGIDRETPDPERGTIVRDAAGHPTGLLIERPAFESIARLLPEPTFDEQVAQLERASRAYNAAGITAVRDPGLSGDEFRIYQATADTGRLTVRSRLMLRMFPEWSADRMIDEIQRWHVRTGLGDAMLRLGGVKIFLDGGVEGAALSEPYANDPSRRGHLFLERDELARVIRAAVIRGWDVGCHALGDRAMAIAIDVYEETSRAHSGLRKGRLVLEHACLADATTRKRAISLGLGICVQYPLLQFLGGNMLTYWGEARTEQVLPIRSWVEEGGLVAAGSDHNITFLSPLRAIWGMVTRETVSAGIVGSIEAIDRHTAFELSTTAGARLVDDWRLGPVRAGRHADLVGFAVDPLTCDLDVLPEMTPALTLVGGRAVHDPEDRFVA